MALYSGINSGNLLRTDSGDVLFGSELSPVLTSIFIITVSIVLFVYWFRYTCVLVLNTQVKKDYASQIAKANQLQFLETRTALMSGPQPAALDTLQRSLDQDYRLLSYLLEHAAKFNVGDMGFEQVMLKADFKLMSVWYSVVRRFSPNQASNALLEMSSIVAHLANAMGERVATSSRA